MFTYGHMILLGLSIILLIGLLVISRNVDEKQVKKITRVSAIIITILEGIQIGFNFYFGYTWINAWFPMWYCGIFIYSLWLSGYGKGKWRRMGDSFLAGASMIAGATYLVFPATALTIYPTWHYLSIYSMFFHTMMIYIGILYFYKLDIKLNKQLYKSYVKYFLFFALIAFVLNNYCGSNLMMLKKPANIPIPLAYTLYKSMPWAYTVIVFIVYLFVIAQSLEMGEW